MSPMAILKLLGAAKKIRDYVVKENNLDQQMGSVRARLAALEKMSHPAQEFICCRRCGCKITKTKTKSKEK